MELEQAWFVLEHGSAEGLSSYLKAIRTIKAEYERISKELEELKDKISFDKELAEAIGLVKKKNEVSK